MPIPDEVKENICKYADQVLAVLLPIIGTKPVIALAVKIAVATICKKPLASDALAAEAEEFAEAQALANEIVAGLESIEACDGDDCPCDAS